MILKKKELLCKCEDIRSVHVYSGTIDARCCITQSIYYVEFICIGTGVVKYVWHQKSLGSRLQ
jgi:hypothetical protein